MTLEPIGIFHSGSKYPYEARRQATADASNSLGEIRLRHDLHQAVQDLEGFERIWIVYQFHHNTDWKPMVMPPRGPRIKRGVFATRAPYRPNAIGLSCVRLVKIEGLRVIVEGHDLLDETPVFDIKPYLPYADAFPEARVGWLEDIESERWAVRLTETAEKQLRWLEKNGVSQLRGFIEGQLQFDPLDHKRKRVTEEGGAHVLAYRTWRVHFTANDGQVSITFIRSGYTQAELNDRKDPYDDKVVHRAYVIDEQL